MLTGLTYKALSGMSRRLLNQHGKKFAFMHIPKNAGSSVMKAIRRSRQWTWNGHIDGPKTRQFFYSAFDKPSPSDLAEFDVQAEHELLYFRQTILLERLQYGLPIVSGHTPFPPGTKRLFPNYLAFTVIRDPIDRYFSALNFGISKIPSYRRLKSILEQDGAVAAVETFLDSPMSQFEGCLQYTFLAGKPFPKPENIPSQAVIADDILSRFDAIGIQEDLTSLEQWLRSNSALESSQKLPRVNVTHSSSKRKENARIHASQLPKEILANVEEHCSIDIHVYHALRRKLTGK